MSLSDTIADMLTRLRNAATAKHRYVDVHYSRMNKSIAEILQNKGYLASVLVSEERRVIRLFLKYDRGAKKCVLTGIRRISKPGARQYVGFDRVPSVMSGLGVSILSTSAGVIDGDTARHQKVGGELLCLVW